MPGPDKKTVKRNTKKITAEEKIYWEHLQETKEDWQRFQKERLEYEKQFFTAMLNKPSNAEKGDQNRITDKAWLYAFTKDMQLSLFNKESHLLDTSSEDTKKNSYMEVAKELKKEDNTPVSENIPAGQDPLELILQDVRLYCGLDHTANATLKEQSENKRKIENRLAKRIMRRLNALSEKMEAENEEANRHNAQVHEEYQQKMEKTIGKRKTGEELQEDPEYQKLLKDHVDDDRIYAVNNLKNYFDAQLYGKLGLVPEEPFDTEAPHLIETGSYININEYESAVLKEVEKHNNIYVLEEDHRNDLMFPHTPSPKDVNQRQIGDCFLLATLSEIAAKHPDKIKEMMCDNQDGTVTVRFYHRTQDGDGPDAFSPFYVTVDKIVTKGQAEESLWVQTIERAYAVSGLHESGVKLRKQGINLEEEKIAARCPHPWGTYGNVKPQRWVPTFDVIDGSKVGVTMYSILGNDATIRTKEISSGIFDSGNTPLTENELRKIEVTRKADKNEKKYVNAIKKAIESGALVCASSRNANGGDHVKVAGIPKNHAYSVLGIVEKNIEGTIHYFVKLRNPHGKGGRDYKVNTVDGKKILVPTTTEGGIFRGKRIDDGTCYVEIRHFKHEFNHLAIADVKDSSLTKTEKLANQEFQTMVAYHEAFKDIYKYLNDKVPSWRGSSKKYDALKAAIKKAVKNPAVTYAELEKHINNITEKMTEYLKHAATVAGDPALRFHKQNACNALSIVLRAAGNGFMPPKAYAKEVLADRVLDDFKNQYKRAEKAQKEISPEIVAAWNLIRDDRTAARKNVMESNSFSIVDKDSNMVELGKSIYSPDAVFKVINANMVAPQKKEFVEKTTEDLLENGQNDGPAAGPRP